MEDWERQTNKRSRSFYNDIEYEESERTPALRIVFEVIWWRRKEVEAKK
jgi:hypothetical protein